MDMRRRFVAGILGAGARAALGLVAACVFAGTAAARDLQEGFDVNAWKPALDPYGYVTVNGAKTLEPLQPHIQLAASYAKNPVRFTSDSTTDGSQLIEELTVADLGASIGLIKLGKFGGLQVGADLPVKIFSNGRRLEDLDLDQRHTVVGDLRTQVKATILDRDEDIVGFAVRLEAIWPTSRNEGDLLTNLGNTSLLGTLIVEKKIDKLRVGAEVGYQWLDGSLRLGDVKFDDKLLVGVGAGYDIFEKLSVNAELFHTTRISNPWDHETESPIEAGLAFKWQSTFYAQVGANAGLNSGVAAPDYRFHIMVGVTF